MIDRKILENEILHLEILPERGGKIASLIDKRSGFQFAAQTGRPYRLAGEDAAFGDFDMSGIDDAFPNIDAETIPYQGRTLRYPDHGEIWSHPMQLTEESGSGLALQFESSRFQYQYRKCIRIGESSVFLTWRITNCGDHDLPCFYTFHGLLTYRKDVALRYPGGIRHMVNVLENEELGRVGRIYSYPSKEYDFDHFPVKDVPYMEKYYGMETVGQGDCSVVYPSDHAALRMEWNAQELPWLGVWVTAGALQGDYNFAMEMTNGFYDSVSRGLANQKIPVLKPGETMNLSLTLTAGLHTEER